MNTTRDMSGKVILVTGANSGLGLATAAALKEAGATVLLHGRDPERVRGAVTALAERRGGEVEALTADFARLGEVERFAADVARRRPRLDVLINNAGLIRDRLELTEDGYEIVFQINHLATFLLTLLLLPILRAAPSAQVVTVASGAHGMVRDLELDHLVKPPYYDPMHVYARSKACNILFSAELARRLQGTSVVANAVHPGLVRTHFGRDGDVHGWLRWLVTLLGPFMRTPERGARSAIWLARSEPEAVGSGGYFIDCRRAQPRTYARNAETARRLWELSERLVAKHLQAGAVHVATG